MLVVKLDGEIMMEGMVASFIDGELRGVQAETEGVPNVPAAGEYGGKVVWALSVLGHKSAVSGRTVAFEYSRDGQTSVKLETTLLFAAVSTSNAFNPLVLQGSAPACGWAASSPLPPPAPPCPPSSPAEAPLSSAQCDGEPTSTNGGMDSCPTGGGCGERTTLTLNVHHGWNWFSLSVVPDDWSIKHVLDKNAITLLHYDAIKSHNTFTTFCVAHSLHPNPPRQLTPRHLPHALVIRY